ncbi:MAG TPA: ABC transporter permease [Phycisphaerales bacterium]|nr:ABC transporter permease [Phycisphaerales bacterium]
MLSLPFVIARTTFIESLRQPITFILVAMSAVLMILLTAATGFTLSFSESGENSGDNKLLLDFGLATVLALAVLLAGFIATATMSREIENRTVMTIVSKPVPRPALVIGKWLGVTAAQIVTVATMLVFLLLAIRHTVMSTAADTIDGPVWVFGSAALLLALAIGVWGSFFYGWSFPQTATLALFPLMLVAWVLVLMVSKKWVVQPIWHDFKPQTVVACLALLLAMPVLTSIAVAASSRLGQVMTIVVCFGLFVVGMASTSVIGRYAVRNDPIGEVLAFKPALLRMETLRNPGDTAEIEAPSGFRIQPRVGQPLYFAASPNGVDAPVSFQPPPYPPPANAVKADGIDPAAYDRPALVVASVNDRRIGVITVGRGDVTLPIERAPRKGDYLFLTPTTYSAPAMAAWGVIPNLQFFWLLDAVNQNQPVPAQHLALVAAYSATQVCIFLGLAVILFQRRDVG